MSETTELPIDPVEAPPAEPDAPPVDAAPPIDPDAALDAVIEANTVELPSGERLAPVEPQKNAIIALRRELKEAKQGSKRAEALEAQLAQMQQQLAALQPEADAFRAIRTQALVQPPPTGPTAEDTRELEEVARDYDFYRADGSLDTDRANRHLVRVRKEAEKIAQAQVAPLQRQSLQQQVQSNVQRALATTHPVNGDTVDAGILQALVQQVATQPGGLETLADPEAMKQMWLNAYTLSSLNPARKRSEAAPQAAVVPPVVTERSGGAAESKSAPMSAAERRAAKEMGLSEAAYLKMAAGMKW
jgi:hypothetical protein